ncbi:MAG: HD domain-containing protein [Candidatus Bathyarchaeota archaeon]|nr:HD domain-containing protein [Candidatus Bathyarchaeota archaeon]
MDELDVVRVSALLHDIGKLECWANRRPWSEHVEYTYRFVKACFGEEIALHAKRHHSGPSYADECLPKDDVERIVCLADNISSGADRRDQPSKGPFIPSPPVKLTHTLAGNIIRKSTEASHLAYLSQMLLRSLVDAGRNFSEDSKRAYSRVFNILKVSDLRFIPADTRDGVNDVSLWNHLKLAAAFATCIYLSGGWRGDDPSRYEFALLSGDADRISNFINESLRLPDLNARSRLIINATLRAKESLSEVLGPECVLYASGGSFLAISPPGLAEKALNVAEESFVESVNGLLSITTCFIISSGDRLMDAYGQVWREAIQKMRREKGTRLLIPRVELQEDVEPCDVCRMRPGMMEDKLKLLPIDAAPRFERLCVSCWGLREMGKGVELEKLKDERNLVGCIKADGDGVGRLLEGEKFAEKGRACTPSRISTLSDLIHGVFEERFIDVLEKFGGEPVYMGGDDLLAFTPGNAALEFAKEAYSVFRREMAGECTLSAGVAIFDYKLPVYVGVEAAGYLLSKAKSEGKNKIAYAAIGGAGVTSTELRMVKSWSWDALDKILDIANFMRASSISSSQLRRVAEAAASRRGSGEGRVRAEVLTKYLVGREYLSWSDGEKILKYLETDLLAEAYFVYNLFKGSLEDVGRKNF